jgi:hypothetical protein
MGIGIRFRLPANAPERMAFAYSPLFEELLALHVLTEPEHHPLQHDWARETWARLKQPLADEVRAWDFAYTYSVPEFALPPARGPITDLEGALRELAELPRDSIAYELVRVLFQGEFGDQTIRDPGELLDDGNRAAALANTRERGERATEIAELAFDDPGAFVEQFASLLRSFYEAVFEDEWTRLEPMLAHSVGDARQSIARGDIYDFLQQAFPEETADRVEEHITFDRDCDTDLTIGRGEHLTLVPSAFVRPHVWISYDEPWPRAVIYTPPEIEGFFDSERPGATAAPG